MFGWFQDYGYYGSKLKWDEGKLIDPSLRTFKEFLDHSNFTVEVKRMT